MCQTLENEIYQITKDFMKPALTQIGTTPTAELPGKQILVEGTILSFSF